MVPKTSSPILTIAKSSFKIGLGVFCSYVIRFLRSNFILSFYSVNNMLKNDVYFSIKTQKTPYRTFPRAKLFLGIRVGVSCRCAMPFQEFYIQSGGQIVSKMTFISPIEHGFQNSSYNLHYSQSSLGI